MMNVEQLNVLRTKGNQLFLGKSYSAAIEVYSKCISACTSTSGGVDCEEDEVRHTLLQAWSNRAEAHLKLKKYDNALEDAENALELKADDPKSLNHKARALEGLQRFEEANLCFVDSLKQAPLDKDIREAMIRTKICSEQSQKGNYDLCNFYLGGCKGSFEPCAEYVGPVEIRKAAYGGRGLFVTRNVLAGELMFVSNAFAVAPVDKEYLVLGKLEELAAGSPRHRHQLNSLAYTSSQEEMTISSMDLFIPGSKWSPSEVDEVEINRHRISKIVYFNSYKLKGVTANVSEFYDTDAPKLAGVWALPSFLNHSCAPNTLRMHIGNTMFVRAKVAIPSGEELTTTYVDSSDVLENRQRTCKTWGFDCRCPRCMFEQGFEPLQRMGKVFYNLIRAHNAGSFNGQLMPTMANHYRGVEEMIQSSPRLTPQQKNWIRASCAYAYIAAVRVVENDLRSKIGVLDQLVEAVVSVSCGDIVGLEYACNLLRDVGQYHGTSSLEYLKVEKRVLDIFRVTYGTHNRKALLALIEKIQKHQEVYRAA